MSRRLAAILVADVVGYSRLMASDEGATLSALRRHRETLFDPAVAAHGGRIVKLMGDGALVEFGSVVDAVNFAIGVQKAALAETALPKITLRIGINLGDIIVEGSDIYGDGVNIAARLEPLAEPGGICVASIVNESIGGRIDVNFTDAGEVEVKNINRPIRVWKWHPRNGSAAPTPIPAAKPASATPSIAVLPFSNMSGDAEQEYFSDGITEDIITDLSKVAGLMVIARNSSFVYKEKNTDVRTIGRELGVRSVLEGSIRRAGNRVRITAQLIDATTGGHLWAERYDRDLTDIFAVQDEVTRQIVSALKVKLSPAEAALLTASASAGVDAHDLFLRGRQLLASSVKTREMFDKACALFRQSIESDPRYADPYAGLSMAYGLDYQNRWTDDPDRSLKEATRLVEKSIELNPNEPYVHFVAAMVAMFSKDLDRATIEAETVLALNPNSALAHNARGFILIYKGQPLAAIPLIEQAIRLDPAMSPTYLHFLGVAYLCAEKYETATVVFKQRILQVPETDLTHAFLVSALGHLGQIDEARQTWRELLQINPKYTFADHLGRLPFRNQADVARIEAGLAKAGLPD